jgi:general secretion pathway protein G
MELVVTLALLGLMALMAAPMSEVAVQRAQEQQLREGLREIRTALDRYRFAADQGLIERQVGDSGYPPNLEVLVNGVPNKKSPGGELMVFLRRVPRNPFAPSELQPASATWGLRSYTSPADAPAPGADVFDVYTRAPGTGLNGIPYRDW